MAWSQLWRLPQSGAACGSTTTFASFPCAFCTLSLSGDAAENLVPGILQWPSENEFGYSCSAWVYVQLRCLINRNNHESDEQGERHSSGLSWLADACITHIGAISLAENWGPLLSWSACPTATPQHSCHSNSRAKQRLRINLILTHYFGVHTSAFKRLDCWKKQKDRIFLALLDCRTKLWKNVICKAKLGNPAPEETHQVRTGMIFVYTLKWDVFCHLS